MKTYTFTTTAKNETVQETLNYFVNLSFEHVENIETMSDNVAAQNLGAQSAVLSLFAEKLGGLWLFGCDTFANREAIVEAARVILSNAEKLAKRTGLSIMKAVEDYDRVIRWANDKTNHTEKTTEEEQTTEEQTTEEQTTEEQTTEEQTTEEKTTEEETTEEETTEDAYQRWKETEFFELFVNGRIVLRTANEDSFFMARSTMYKAFDASGTSYKVYRYYNGLNENGETVRITYVYTENDPFYSKITY